MTIASSGIRDTARVLGNSKATVIRTLKSRCSQPSTLPLPETGDGGAGPEACLGEVCQAELDGQWSYVGNKSN